MNALLRFDFDVNKETNSVHIVREFAAGRNLVWKAFTTPEILDQWWAPKPWKTETQSMDFREGGRWVYCMVGPEGERHWCLNDYYTIDPEVSYSGLDAFCNEDVVINPALPRSLWKNHFEDKEGHTLVNIEVKYEKLSELEAIIQMGFKEGFTMALENLDGLLAEGLQ